jgi:molybdopterin-guanine dinucleotide biosynthesis protein
VRPVIIGIGGGHSGAGKTSVATNILQSFRSWGAIKYTRTSLYASIVDDSAVVSQEGKDTKRLLEAGAGKVIWVQAPYAELEAVLPVAMDMLADLEGIVIEGNSPMDFIRPDIVVFVAGSRWKMKSSANRVLHMADIVIYRSQQPPETPGHAILFKARQLEGLIPCLAGLITKARRNVE